MSLYKETVDFWTTRGKYGCFSNFSKHPISVGGIVYQTTEHYYQAQKMLTPEAHMRVVNADGPKEAKNVAYMHDIRDDWEDVKYDVMMCALEYKTIDHPHIEELLMETGDLEIREVSKYDAIWGTGPNGDGQNLLGKAWMQLRDEIRAEQNSFEI